ncbi:MAG: RecX family transcriptional regulator [Planifilum sp.]|jgi:regulatory protein
MNPTENGVITRIERLPGRPRYRIFVDDSCRFTVEEDVLIKCGLTKGMTVDPERLASILETEEWSRARRLALRYLASKRRTAWELEQMLRRKGVSSAHREAVLEEFHRFGYLDDHAFARDWVEERRSRKGYGAARIRRELEEKGISPELIDRVLGEVDEEDEFRLAMEVAERRLSRMRDLPWAVLERRLGRQLLNRGFSSTVVLEVLERVRSTDREEEG